MNKQKYVEVRSELNFSPRPGVLCLHLLQDILLGLMVTGLLLTKSYWAYALSQCLLAALYFRAFSLMHDAVHGALSRDHRVNDWLGVIYGGICFLPYTTWRSVHLEHHAWAGNAEKDPVMKMVREFPGKPEARKNLDTFLWRSWIPYMALLQELVFWSASAKLLLEKDKFQGKYAQLLAAVASPLLFGAALGALGHSLGNILMMAPSILVYLVMVEVVNFPHHLRLPRVIGETKLALWEQYRISRTCVYSAWFSRLVLLNFNYHAEHHMFPSLPWHELPKAHEKVRAAVTEGYELCRGHEWIRVNRRKDLREVLAPTRILEPNDFADKPKAA